MSSQASDPNVGLITPEDAVTLAGLFRERVKRSPDMPAYQHYDAASQSWVKTNWRDMSQEVARWQQAFSKANLQKGDRVGVMLGNGREWVLFDQAVLGLGLVSVPLYVEDRPENAAYILHNANVKLLLVEGEHQWQSLLSASDGLPTVEHILSLEAIGQNNQLNDARLASMNDWLFGVEGQLQALDDDPDALASIVYTSGTTGHPKGVMLSHRNMLMNAWLGLTTVDLEPGKETFLSFLPLSHTLERTIGYYLPMIANACVAYNRSIDQLAEDLLAVRPTLLISVPRIYERVYNRIVAGLKDRGIISRWLFNLAWHVGWQHFLYKQGDVAWSPIFLIWPLLNKLVGKKVMDRLGGRIHIAICGGAALQPEVSRLFISMGLTLMQGYGLTEASPVVSVNRLNGNRPASIGQPLPEVQVRISDIGELQTKSACVMLGYWQNEAATQATFTDDGWLKTGDKASIDEEGYLYITGRLKEIIVLSNGEKVPPVDMEAAIELDPLFEQVMLVGEAKPYLAAVIVLSQEVWHEIAPEYKVDPQDEAVLQRQDITKRVLLRVSAMLKEFPGYANVRRVHLTLESWTVESGLLTPTLKMKRNKLQEKYAKEIEGLYQR